MRALTYDRFAPASGLTVTDAPEPAARAGEVVVGVEVASPNPVDWHLYQGQPWAIRLLPAARARRGRIPGADFAGVVLSSADPSVSVGARVFGTIPAGLGRDGSMAERVAVSPQWLAPVPSEVSTEQAGVVGLAGLTALQALRDSGRMSPGARVLVWGASGGVGHLAVQIARILGASRVDAVCSGRSAEMVSSFGADEIFDYTRGDEPSGPYDVVIDTVCTASNALLGRIARGRTVVTIGALAAGRLLGPAAPMVARRVAAPMRGFSARGVLTRVNVSDLALLGDWMSQGSLRVVVAAEFPLAQADEAYRVLEAGGVHGKVAVRVASR